MTAYNGTVTIPGRAGSVGQVCTALGTYALTGALVAADTITFANMLPQGGAKIIGGKFVSPELDTNASPTATIKVGNTDDDDGYIQVTGVGVNLSNSLAEPVVRHVNGDLIGTTVRNRDVILTVVGAVATGASSGTLRLWLELEGLAG